VRRRFVYNATADCVVEVGVVRGPGLSAHGRYRDVYGEYQDQFDRAPSDGRALLAAALDRAERREWSVKKFGTESRWAD